MNEVEVGSPPDSLNDSYLTCKSKYAALHGNASWGGSRGSRDSFEHKDGDEESEEPYEVSILLEEAEKPSELYPLSLEEFIFPSDLSKRQLVKADSFSIEKRWETPEVKQVLHELCEEVCSHAPCLNSVELCDKITSSIRDAVEDVAVETGKNPFSWCKEFINAMSIEDPHERDKMSEDFASIATMYAKVFITERNTSERFKSLHQKKIGGVAGGDKFIVDSILFKVSDDKKIRRNPDRYLYGGESPNVEMAMKAAGNELIGAIHYSKHLPEKFFVPMQTLVDYQGFRVVAMPLLPINSKTLLYGSSDGGLTIHADSPGINEIIKDVGQELHLAGHYVQDKFLFSAGDIEVHQGLDGNTYVLDLARAFPPESSYVLQKFGGFPPEERMIFSRKLRPEFLRFLKENTNAPPLSPDAFTGWGTLDAEQFNREVHQASLFLLNHRIPELAAFLDLIPQSAIPVLNLSKEFHRMGVNMRHLAIVCYQTRSVPMKKKLLREIIVRTLKNNVRECMRKSHQKGSSAFPSSYAMKSALVELFNVLMRSDLSDQGKHRSKILWEHIFRTEVYTRFGVRALTEMKDESFKSIFNAHAYSILTDVCDRCGIQLKMSTLSNLASVKNTSDFWFVVSDVVGFTSSLKSLTLFDQATGTSLLHQAEEKSAFSTIHATRLRAMALEPLKHVVSIDPENTFVSNLIAAHTVRSLSSEMEQSVLESHALNAILTLPSNLSSQEIKRSILTQT